MSNNSFTTSLPAQSVTTFVGTSGSTTTFTLTVTNGTGSGTYAAGTMIPINANAAPSGQVFDRWTGATGADAFSTSTTLAMPSGNATVTATYKSSSNGPIAYWRFDEGSGANAADASGNGHNGTLVNGPVWISGQVNAGLKFSPASSNYVAVPDFNPPSSLTLEAWIFPLNNSGTDSIILDKHNSEYDFRITDQGYLLGIAGGTGLADPTFNFYNSANTGKWYHVAYRNGVQVAAGSNPSSITNHATPLWIGRHSQYNFGTFMGFLDEVKIYGRQLKASEILTDAQATQPGQSPGSAFAPASTLTVLKFAGAVNLSAANRDTATLSGILPDLPQSDREGIRSVTISLNGASFAFDLDQKGRGQSSSGSIGLTLKGSKPVSFKARIKSGAWASVWDIEAARRDRSMTLVISITVKGAEYSAPVATRFSFLKSKAAFKK